jgi:hypothetical protein
MQQDGFQRIAEIPAVALSKGLCGIGMQVRNKPEFNNA